VRSGAPGSASRDGGRRKLSAHGRCDLGAEELDRPHDLRVRHRADAELNEKAVVVEELVLEEDLLDDLLRGADEVRAAPNSGNDSMNEPPPAMISARPPESRSIVAKSWKTRTGSSELRTETSDLDALDDEVVRPLRPEAPSRPPGRKHAPLDRPTDPQLDLDAIAARSVGLTAAALL
jgi:hypothetical protein